MKQLGLYRSEIKPSGQKWLKECRQILCKGSISYCIHVLDYVNQYYVIKVYIIKPNQALKKLFSNFDEVVEDIHMQLIRKMYAYRISVYYGFVKVHDYIDMLFLVLRLIGIMHSKINIPTGY